MAAADKGILDFELRQISDVDRAFFALCVNHVKVLRDVLRLD